MQLSLRALVSAIASLALILSLASQAGAASFSRDDGDIESSVPVVVDLWAEWCGPCKTLSPIIEKVIAETGGRVELAKVDIDKEAMLASHHGVRSVPTVLLYKDGQPVDGFTGAQPEGAIRALLAHHGIEPPPIS